MFVVSFKLRLWILFAYIGRSLLSVAFVGLSSLSDVSFRRKMRFPHVGCSRAALLVMLARHPLRTWASRRPTRLRPGYRACLAHQARHMVPAFVCHARWALKWWRRRGERDDACVGVASERGRERGRCRSSSGSACLADGRQASFFGAAIVKEAADAAKEADALPTQAAPGTCGDAPQERGLPLASLSGAVIRGTREGAGVSPRSVHPSVLLWARACVPLAVTIAKQPFVFLLCSCAGSEVVWPEGFAASVRPRGHSRLRACAHARSMRMLPCPHEACREAGVGSRVPPPTSWLGGARGAVNMWAQHSCCIDTDTRLAH